MNKEERIASLQKELKEFKGQFIIGTSEFIIFKRDISSLLDTSYKKKILLLTEIVDGPGEEVISTNSQCWIEALISDQIRSLVMPADTKKDLEINKLLKAREENIDFEVELAMMITGDNESFPGRSSFYLTRFFQELGFNFEHDGSTKRFWVANQLKKLTIEQIYEVVTSGIFKRKHFINGDKDIDVAKREFASFIEDSIKSNELIDLSDVFNLNVQNELLFNQQVETSDKILNSLITSARTLFLQGNTQLAIEKIWDALERIKTLLNKEKKKGIEAVCNSLGDELPTDFFDTEYNSLTKVGNDYQIRHFETSKKPLENPETKKYLFFRALSLINLTLSRIQNTKKQLDI